MIEILSDLKQKKAQSELKSESKQKKSFYFYSVCKFLVFAHVRQRQLISHYFFKKKNIFMFYLDFDGDSSLSN